MALVFVICKCPQYNLINRSKKDIKEDLKNQGSYGLKKSENSNFDYVRNSLCGACGSSVYFKLGYTKKTLYNWACDQAAKKLRSKT